MCSSYWFKKGGLRGRLGHFWPKSSDSFWNQPISGWIVTRTPAGGKTRCHWVAWTRMVSIKVIVYPPLSRLWQEPVPGRVWELQNLQGILEQCPVGQEERGQGSRFCEWWHFSKLQGLYPLLPEEGDRAAFKQEFKRTGRIPTKVEEGQWKWWWLGACSSSCFFLSNQWITQNQAQDK